MSPVQSLGSVALVGAGPGDPDLLTVKAVRLIAAADVILVDDLVDRAVLAHARADVRVVEVGKRGGHASTPQGFINRLLVREARAGHRVVRLKGGDPYLFGRGGEERDALEAAGIAVTVVPGITSGLAAPMAAGISVTHRDASPGVIFVTGHEKKTDGPARVRWDLLAQSGLTLVVYMGLTRADDIRRALLDGGLPADTPVAAIASATRPGQKVCTATLDAMTEALAADGIASPAILVIGTVARSASQACALASRASAAA